MTLEQLFNHAKDRAAAMFDQCGELVPMWHAVTANDEHLIIATPWSDNDEKAQTIIALRAMFAEKHVKQLVFICEAWMVSLQEAPSGNLPAPSQHPDRREVIQIHAEDIDGNNFGGRYFILRPEHGPPRLSKFNQDKAEVLSGQMVGLLKHSGTKH